MRRRNDPSESALLEPTLPTLDDRILFPLL
jgi:hypothetical protein